MDEAPFYYLLTFITLTTCDQRFIFAGNWQNQQTWFTQQIFIDGLSKTRRYTHAFYLQVLPKYIWSTSYYVTRKKCSLSHFVSEQETEEELRCSHNIQESPQPSYCQFIWLCSFPMSCAFHKPPENTYMHKAWGTVVQGARTFADIHSFLFWGPFQTKHKTNLWTEKQISCPGLISP